MCGIGGWLGIIDGNPRRVADDMQQRLAHRGPDGRGAHLEAALGLVHTRLSIIDTSTAGAQPMANEEGTVWSVFNGEIYNHKSLREELEGKGHKFAGRCDAEVLPHLYEEEGADFVRRLRGIFAIGIYDSRARRLLLVRDRFGVKPLFYAPQAGRLAFASEIRALRAVPGTDDAPDPQAISDFAAMLFIPAPETFFSGIRALDAGEILEATWTGDRVTSVTRCYHQWTIPHELRITLSDAADQATELISRAVDRQLESDVPMGSLLSGGIDSSLVSAAAQSGLNGTLQSYNVQFPDVDYDETWAARAVADHIGSHHKTLSMDAMGGTWEAATGLLAHAGQPFADTSIFAANAVCRLIRQHEVKMVLAGDGGDEGFAGYDSYWRIAALTRIRGLAPPFVLRAAARGLAPLARMGWTPRSLPRRLKEVAGADDATTLANLSSWVPEEEHRRLCRVSGVLPVRRWFEQRWPHELPSDASRLDRLFALARETTIRLRMKDDFLFKVDTASMREGLEVRVPMLDEDLFEFGLSLPHHLNVRGRTCKRVLREVAARQLPSAVAQKPKRGFAVPVDRWSTPDLKRRISNTLLGRSAKLHEFFDPNEYRPLVEAFAEGGEHPGVSRGGIYQRVFMLLAVELALSPNGD